MDPEVSVFEKAQIPSSDPRFLKRVFFQTAKGRKEKKQNSYSAFAEEEFGSLSRRFEKSLFQEASLARNLIRARKIAEFLITDQGELKLGELPLLLEELEAHAYFLGPGWESDAPRQAHLISLLKLLHENKALQRALRLISRPENNKNADDIIRQTLLLPENSGINDALARKAALSALLCHLRQNVGSCFATAPAIILQNEQPEQFLKDIDELLSTGRMKRVAGGVEYSVPLTHSFGSGNLSKAVAVESSNSEQIALSPGLLHGFENAGLIDSSLHLKEKIEKSKNLVLEALKNELQKRGGQQFLITAENVIKAVLMAHFKINEKELAEYLDRPRLLVQTTLMMSAPQSAHGMGGKGEACSAYLVALEKAKIGFKIVEENALLKSWEYTLASFAETKPGFTRWNMYASLGFNSDEPGGIGAYLYGEIKDKLDRANSKVQEMQYDYETVYSQLKFMEGRMRGASSEREAHWLRMEYEAKRNEYNTLEEIRNREHFKAQRYANLLSEMIDAYDELFPNYFQEVYDPDMHDVEVGPYEDSPAGFRLLYKHGRKNTGQWTLIHNPQEFIEALVSFFSATEIELVGREEFEGLQQDISDLVTGLILHVRKDEFMETAFHRMAKAHDAPLIKDPLKHLDKIDKKPWAYTSGGTMDNLVACYFKLGHKPFQQERWVEDETELLVFLLDTLKQMPPGVSEEVKRGARRVLIHSPTHAFTVKGDFPELVQSLSQELFTYTYVRDHLIVPYQKFIERQLLTPAMSSYLFNQLSEKIPKEFRPRFNALSVQLFGERTPSEFRSALCLEVEHDKLLYRNGYPVVSREAVDSLLFESLPFTPREKWAARMTKLLKDLPGLSDHADAISKGIDEIIALRGEEEFLSAQQLQNLCKALLCRILNETSTPYNYSLLVADKARELGYAMPVSLRFADTNWVNDYFAFLVNPGTGTLDFWRVNADANQGFRMSSWDMWLNGSRKDRTWGLYTKPHEYRLT